MALLSQQRIATVTRSEAFDGELFREMDDEAALWIELTDRVQTPHELAIMRDTLESGPPNPRHDDHVENDVGTIGDFNAATGQRRVDRPHAVGNDIERALAHASAEQIAHLRVRLVWIHPVVVRTRVFL